MEYHKDRFRDHSLLVFKDEKLVALLPANSEEDIIFSHQGLTYGGVVVSSALRFEDALESFKAILKYLQGNGFETLEFKEIPSIYNVHPSDEMKYFMFLCEAQLVRRDALSVIDLNSDIKFSNSRFEGCKRAEKYELVLKEADDFEEYWNNILIPNLSEKHRADPVHSLSEIEKLKNLFPDNIRQFNVYHDNNIVAGATIFETERVAHVQYISGNRDKNTLGSLDALFSYLIKDVFNKKHYFDFGMSNENQGKTVNKGLQFWKEGFGARTITQDFFKVNTADWTKLNTILQ